MEGFFKNFILEFPPNTRYFQGSHQVKHSCALYCLPLLCFSDLITSVGLQDVFGDGHMLTNKYCICELNRWPWKHLASCNASSHVLTFEIPLTHTFLQKYTSLQSQHKHFLYVSFPVHNHAERERWPQSIWNMPKELFLLSSVLCFSPGGLAGVCVSNSITFIPAHTPLSLPQLTHSVLQPFLRTFC